MFKRQRHYSSLFGRLKADQRKVCELQWSGIAPLMSTLCLPDIMHIPSPSVFAYCKRSKNFFEIKQKQNKTKAHPRNAKSMQANKSIRQTQNPCRQTQNASQSAASVHSSWTLLMVANAATHQLQTADEQEYSQRACREKNQYDTLCSIQWQRSKNTNFCFARVQLQLLKNDYYPNAAP